MPAKSKSQQQAAGVALAAKRGTIPANKLYGAAKSMHKSMSAEELKHYAETSHKALKRKLSKRNG